jgi:hypothetical protein
MAFAHRREPRPIGEMIRERDRAEALEAADNGHLQEVAMWKEIEALGEAIAPAPSVPLDPELRRVLESDCGCAREKMVEASRLSDANREQEGMAELNMAASKALAAVDEAAEALRRLES